MCSKTSCDLGYKYYIKMKITAPEVICTASPVVTPPLVNGAVVNGDVVRAELVKAPLVTSPVVTSPVVTGRRAPVVTSAYGVIK